MVNLLNCERSYQILETDWNSFFQALTTQINDFNTDPVSNNLNVHVAQTVTETQLKYFEFIFNILSNLVDFFSHSPVCDKVFLNKKKW